MAYANYAFPERQTFSLVRENKLWHQLVGRLMSGNSTPSSFISTMQSLEEEIYILRMRMERMYDTEQSLSSPRIVEISMLLDRKINQWMEMEKGQSR